MISCDPLPMVLTWPVTSVRGRDHMESHINRYTQQVVEIDQKIADLQAA